MKNAYISRRIREPPRNKEDESHCGVSANSKKTKSATAEAIAQKTQAPIVAKQTVSRAYVHVHHVGICVFIKFIVMVREKDPSKSEWLCLHLFSLFGNFILSQIVQNCNTFFKVYIYAWRVLVGG